MLPPDLVDQLLGGLRDLASNEDLLHAVEEESVFGTSLLRYVSLSVIHGRCRSVLAGDAPLTEYHFAYKKLQTKSNSGIDIDFHVEPNTRPPTNIHILIGRNGADRTTLLNNMVNSIIDVQENTDDAGGFYDTSRLFFESLIPDNYFSSVVSVSFSVPLILSFRRQIDQIEAKEVVFFTLA